MSIFDEQILLGMNRAIEGYLDHSEELASDDLGNCAFFEAFEAYQDALIAFQDKIDELLSLEPDGNKNTSFDEGKLSLIHTMAKETAYEVLRDRQKSRESAALQARIKLNRSATALRALEDSLRIKEGVLRAASSRMIATMNVVREMECIITENSSGKIVLNISQEAVELKVAKQMQVASQNQASLALKDFQENLDYVQTVQGNIEVLEEEARLAQIISYAAKYVTENAVFTSSLLSPNPS